MNINSARAAAAAVKRDKTHKSDDDYVEWAKNAFFSILNFLLHSSYYHEKKKNAD